MPKPIEIDAVNDDMDGYGALDLKSVSIERSVMSIELKSSPDHDICIRHIRIECHQPVAFRLTSKWIGYVESTRDSILLKRLTDPRTTYVIVGETANWPMLLGELVQHFGHIHDLVDPAHLRETTRHANYRLPLQVPATDDSSLRAFLDARAVQYYEDRKWAPPNAREAILFGCDAMRDGFVLADRITAFDLIPIA
jgi:hypothetical protein